ncbi:MDR family MFS transporter [Oryzihumus leptocrescens]|uniref:EmrB/QacA subfamily drug resistance transporter n=1 Tax=Oryzihumus leptocrescens TaxID=297536 RepID=A0A542Z929_9MICO|nr:MDR family MFS transporter [Oryzihumus leptocrescens]TQL56802.1 EmrB/QacA subfamily drug resistance transporter [Oryzihumus leptocrescens]
MASATPAPATATDGTLTHKQIMTILVGLLMGMFLAALDQTIVASAMRVIADDLNDLAGQAWVTTAYLITSTIVTPLYGKLSDIYGRKKFFVTAITIFILGSVLCAFATSMPMLAAFRAVQGLGAGGLFSLALAIIGDIVPPRERAKYQGYFLAVFGTSSVLGPVIGGFFAGADTILGITGWRWVFLVNVPIGIAALFVVARTLHLRHTRLDHRIDWWGAVTLTVGLVPLLIVAEQGRDWGWSSSSSITCFAIGGLGLIAFFLIERAMGHEALLPIYLFRIRTVGVSSIASVVLGMGMFGGLVSLPLYLQIVKGATPTQAGLMLVPMTLGIMAGSVISGQAISRTGRYRHFPIIGSALLVIGLFMFHYVAFDTPLWQVMVLMVVFGLGLGFNMQPLTLAVQNAVSPREIGVATSSATFTRQIGGTIGTAVFLSILFSSVPLKLAEAFRVYFPTPDFQAALRNPTGNPAANANVIAALKSQQAGGGTGAGANPLSDSSFIQQIDPRLAKPFLVGFSEAMDRVFLVGSAVMVVAFIVLWFLPHVELRSGSSYSERGKSDAADAEAAAAVPPIAH